VELGEGLGLGSDAAKQQPLEEMKLGESIVFLKSIDA
jgi:hypothetical protein